MATPRQVVRRDDLLQSTGTMYEREEELAVSPQGESLDYVSASNYQAFAGSKKNERVMVDRKDGAVDYTSAEVVEREIPYGCFWNHGLDNNNENNGAPVYLNASKAADSSTGADVLFCESSASMSIISPQASSFSSRHSSLAGDKILDDALNVLYEVDTNVNKTSAFTLPMHRLNVDPIRTSLPSEIQLSLNNPASVRSYMSASSQEGIEVEAPYHIRTSSTFESLSASSNDGSGPPPTPHSPSAQTPSDSSSCGYAAAKKVFEQGAATSASIRKTVSSKSEEEEDDYNDKFCDIEHTHTETTAATDCTTFSLQVETVGSYEAEAIDGAEKGDTLPILLGVDEPSVDDGAVSKRMCTPELEGALVMDTSMASECSDFFTGMLQSETITEETVSVSPSTTSIDVATPTAIEETGAADDDPFAWAYDVWKRKGLMKGVPAAPPRAHAMTTVVAPASIPVSARAAHFDMDLSGATETPVLLHRANRLSLPAVPVSAKKPGFDAILNRWRQKSDEQPLPQFLSLDQGHHGPPALQEPKLHMGVRNQIIVASEFKSSNIAKEAPCGESTSAWALPGVVDSRPTTDALPFGKLATHSHAQPAKHNPDHESQDKAYRADAKRSVRYSMESTASKQSSRPFASSLRLVPDSQATRLVNQLAKKASRKKPPFAGKSPPKSSRSYKTAVQAFLEDDGGLEQILSRRESQGAGDPSRDIPVQCKVATIARKSASAPVESCKVSTTADAACLLSTVIETNTGFEPGPQDTEQPPRLRIDAMASYDNRDSSFHDCDSLMTPNALASGFTSTSVQSRLISSDSPWKALLKIDEEIVDDTTKRRTSFSRPWDRDVAIYKTCSSGLTSFAPAHPSDENVPCSCSASVFSSNDEMINFMLPLMGMACTCGKNTTGLRNPEEPTSLENILRDWQVDFLGAFGIYRGDQLVKAHHRSAAALASALRRYRKKHGLQSFPTKSCAMALSIWAKTSKAFVRSIRKQLTNGFAGELKIPNTLYIVSSFLEQMPSDGSEKYAHQPTGVRNSHLGSPFGQPGPLSRVAGAIPFGEDFAEM